MTQAGPLEGRRILVVEDDYLLALVLIELLEEMGARVIGPIGTVGEAIAFVADNCSAFDTAVLDVNLRGEMSYPIADMLVAHGVRFVFSTGYSADALDYAYRDYPRCEKPFNHQALVDALIR